MNAIGRVKLDNPLILAPMADIFDLPVRLTFRKFGFGLSSIGSISAEAVVKQARDKLINICGKEDFTDERESMVMVQLIGSDEHIMAQAAELVAKKAAIIDLNFGCPLKWITRKGWGAALLENISLMQAIIKAVVKSVDIPVTAKIRIVSSENFVKTIDIAHCCEDAGAAALIVHTRTPKQKFVGRAHWEILPQIKRTLHIPLVGNGNVRSLADVRTLLEEFGCDFVMVGTQALRTPLAFLEKIDVQKKITLWDFAQCYACQRGKHACNVPFALAKFMALQLRVSYFVRSN